MQVLKQLIAEILGAALFLVCLCSAFLTCANDTLWENVTVRLWRWCESLQLWAHPHE